MIMIPENHFNLAQRVIIHLIADFEADRGKTNFEKDVDDLLFSGMKPVARRRK